MAISSEIAARDGAVMELGTILCRHCNGMIATLPTESVKVLYGVCRDDRCLSERGAREPMLD